MNGSVTMWLATPSRAACRRWSPVSGPPTRTRRAPQVARAHRREHVEQDVDPLARDGAADVQDLGALGIDGAEQPRRFRIGQGIGARRARGMHAVRHDDEARGGDDAGLHERVARGARAAHHAAGAADAVDQPSRERARQRRPPPPPGQRRLEGIEVVAHHQRPLRRQIGREMRVAVIDDVEQIEVARLLAQPARVVPEPVHEPIRGGHPPDAPGPW